jgi:hypothetical protein
MARIETQCSLETANILDNNQQYKLTQYLLGR